MSNLKQSILEVAQGQLQKGGYDALNFGEIAKELNTTRANIHYHFDDKLTLATEATEQYVAMVSHYTDKIEEEHSDDFIGFIGAFEKWLRDYYQNQSQEMCVCTQHLRFDGTPATLRVTSKDFMNNRLDTFKRIADASKSSGKINKKVDIEQLTIQTLSMLMGQSQMYLFDQKFSNNTWPSAANFVESIAKP